MLQGLVFERPAAFAALILPALLWWFARKPRPPLERATGTLAIWHAVLSDPSVASGGRTHGVPLRLYWTLLALVLGTLGLAGPVLQRGATTERRMLLDTSPSMYLPWVSPEGVGTDKSRMQVALEIADELAPGPALWRRFDGVRWVEARGDAPPDAWLQALNRAAQAPPFSEEDRPDSVWITDRAVAPLHAAWIASGGAALDGPVGVRDGKRLVLRDGALHEDGAASPAVVSLGDGLPELVTQLTKAWARERGLALVPSARAANLRVAASEAGQGTRTVRGGSWSLTARAAAPVAGRVLWRDTLGSALLGTGPGQLELGLARAAPDSAPARLEGDRQAFALDWIAALEAALAPPVEAVSLAERRTAGPGGRGPGSGFDPHAARESAPIAVWLAFLTLCCAALGMRAPARGASRVKASSGALRI